MNQTKADKDVAKTAPIWELIDSNGKLAEIDSWDKLKQVILSIPDQSPTANAIVNLFSPHGDTLSIGIAGPDDRDNPQLTERLACVNFTSETLPNRVVLGNAALTFENGGVIVFRFEGTWTEILRRNCVPIETMLKIVQHFYKNGELPGWIEWEPV